MQNVPESSQPSIESRLSEMRDIADEAKKNKVELTPEVKQYIREHLEAVMQKLVNREDVTEDDLMFMQDVRLWVGLPEEWRGKYRSIEGMNNSEEIQNIAREIKERKISQKQWLTLLHIAEAKEEKKEWIDEIFRFPGNGRIEKNGDLNLKGCTSLTSLPAGLKVYGGLYLTNCFSLTSLPTDLDVDASLFLTNCTSLTTLSADMRVGGALNIDGCTSLTFLPAELDVAGYLILSENLHEQVKKDAERLKGEGKIKGEIEYR